MPQGDWYDPQSEAVLLLMDAMQVKQQKANRGQGVDKPTVERETKRVHTDVWLVEQPPGGFTSLTAGVDATGQEGVSGTARVRWQFQQDYAGRSEPLPVVAITDGARTIRCQLAELFGQPVPVTSGTPVALADWGSLTTVSGGASGTPAIGYRGSVTALEIRLTADHGGLPAGTTILVGYAEVAAQAAPPEPPAQNPRTQNAERGAKSQAPEPAPGFPPIRQPPQVTPKLTAGGYVFPVYGPSSFSDTFGALRGDISSGWHHGDDIFAPLGAPLLAVASGTVFSVGWNKIGGNRLWLRDGQGNLFYYAHLSAFSPLAVNGNKVNAGDVIGFVGNTGDAQGTPFHLHFEIHPVGLLGLGYDGAVDPTSYLNAWQHLQDVSFAGGDAWAPLHSLGSAPKPGAILLAATDISIADGLVPGSLLRAVRPLIVRGDNFSSASPGK